MAFIFHMCIFLWQDLSRSTIIFYLYLELWPTFEKLKHWLLFSDGCRLASVVVFWQLLFEYETKMRNGWYCMRTVADFTGIYFVWQTETESAVAEVMASNENIVIEDTVGNIEDVVAMETQEILETKGFLESQEILVPTQCRVNCLKLFVTPDCDTFWVYNRRLKRSFIYVASII